LPQHAELRQETGNSLADLDNLSCNAAAPQDGARVANAQDGKHDYACMTITPNLKRACQCVWQSLFMLLCLTSLAANRLDVVCSNGHQYD